MRESSTSVLKRAVTAVELSGLSPGERFDLLQEDEAVARFYPPSYGRAIWDTVMTTRPELMIEFGVYRGYTAICAALAMEEANRGRLLGYDSWEDHQEGGVEISRIAEGHLSKYGIAHRVTLLQKDFQSWILSPEPCDLLYFDIDNDGEKVGALHEGLKNQIARGLTILFEGGSPARDEHSTMSGRVPIGTQQLATGYRIIVEDFPSLSVIRKGRVSASSG